MKSRNWSKEEVELLRKVYPTTKNEELPKYFKGKSKNSICTFASRLGLKKEYNHRIENLKSHSSSSWNSEKEEELKRVFLENGECETYIYFKDKYNHGKYYIREKLIKMKLIKVIEVIDKNNAVFCDVFNIYKRILDEELDGFQKYVKNISKQQIVLLFRYYNRTNNIDISVEYLKNKTISKLLDNAKIKNLVKAKFHNYYTFLTYCYPSLNIKPWELKKLGVPNGFWDNKYNRFWCLREGISKAITDNVIKVKSDFISLEYEVLSNYTSSSLMYFYNRDCIVEYFKYQNIGFNAPDIYNGIKFDSIQEAQVYKYIYENFTKDIFKCYQKDGFIYSNRDWNEKYIPDFYIKTNDKKIILVEYFGRYKPNISHSVFVKYCEKADRKVEYYKSLEGVYFIGLYPSDLEDNYKGVRDKLTSFCYAKLNKC